MEAIVPTAFLRSKIDERAALTDVVEGIYTKCNDEQRDPSQEERAKLDDYTGRIKILDGSITELRTQEEANARFLTTSGAIEDAAERTERARTERRAEPEQPAQLSLGEVITGSDAFTEYRMRGASPRIEVHDIFGLDTPTAEERAAITTAQIFPPVGRWDGVPGAAISNPLLSAINRERVSTGSFDYVTWPQVPVGAGGVAKVAEAALKPEVTLAPVLATLSLDTYAGWVQVTRQALEDVPRVRTQIETRLRQNLAATLEAAAAAVIEAATPPQAGGESLAGIREATGSLQSKGYTPNGLLLNPVDFAALDVATMHETNYGPTLTTTYWGLRPIPVPGIPIGTSYVGDFTQAVTWFDRGTTDVYITDSHADMFIRNIFVILAEARAQFAVTDINALVEVGITQPAPAARSGSSKS